MVAEKELEKFPYDNGELDELKKKAFAACSFLEAVDGWERRADEILRDVLKSDDEADVKETLNDVCKSLLKSAPDDPGKWADLYASLFENNIYLFENHYTPIDSKDMIETVKKCVREKKRIRTDLPDGAIA